MGSKNLFLVTFESLCRTRKKGEKISFQSLLGQIHDFLILAVSTRLAIGDGRFCPSSACPLIKSQRKAKGQQLKGKIVLALLHTFPHLITLFQSFSVNFPQDIFAARFWEEPSMDQCRSRLKLSENFQDHWSIRISPGKGMDQ